MCATEPRDAFCVSAFAVRELVPDLLLPIISVEQFDLVQHILNRRREDIGQRAANPSEYTLTGKIRWPAVRPQIHRHRRPRPALPRDRYGTKAGSGIHRFNADHLEAAIGESLLDFYSNHQFERGTLDDQDEGVQVRLSTLKRQTRQHRARKAKLEFELEQPPVAPEPAELAVITQRITEIITGGDHLANRGYSRR